MFPDREQLGEKVTHWIADDRHLDGDDGDAVERRIVSLHRDHGLLLRNRPTLSVVRGRRSRGDATRRAYSIAQACNWAPIAGRRARSAHRAAEVEDRPVEHLRTLPRQDTLCDGP